MNRVNAEDVAETGKIKWDLSHLEEGGREEVFTEQMDLFSTPDADIGNVPDFQMDINSTDSIPVTEAYRCSPKDGEKRICVDSTPKQSQTISLSHVNRTSWITWVVRDMRKAYHQNILMKDFVI